MINAFKADDRILHRRLSIHRFKPIVKRSQREHWKTLFPLCDPPSALHTRHIKIKIKAESSVFYHPYDKRAIIRSAIRRTTGTDTALPANL